MKDILIQNAIDIAVAKAVIEERQRIKQEITEILVKNDIDLGTIYLIEKVFDTHEVKKC